MQSDDEASGQNRKSKDHWVVRMNHRNRTWGFLTLGLIIGLHMAPWSPPWPTWGLLVASFLLYPQIAWALGRLSSDPLAQELKHLVFDAFLLGMWTSGLHFPLWIAFTLFISVTLNMTLFRGLRGLAQAVFAWALGVMVVGTVAGWDVQFHTALHVTLLTLFVLTVYILVTAEDSFVRSMKMHAVQQQLKEHKQGLQSQLAEIHALQTQLQEQALRDPLTGLFNRHRLTDALNREIERCRRTQRPLSLVLIDVDHFKCINDQWGHQVGDEVLKRFAAHLLAHTRSSDWCFRYGGEEFLLVLPDTDASTARQKADTLRQSFAETPLTCSCGPVQVSISAGLSAFPDHGTDMDTLIGQADKALYGAKHKGRNRVAMAAA